MLDWSKLRKDRAPLTENLGKSANAIIISVTEKNPLRLTLAGSDAPETNANILAQPFRGGEP